MTNGEAVESEVVRRARQGDTQAWEDLVSLHQQSVFRLAYLMLGEADDAEDIAQQAFIQAYYALGRFDTTRPVRPWLLQITANLCKNWMRGVSRYLAALQRSFRLEQPLNGERAALPARATHLVEQNQEAELLWQAIRRMSKNDQEMIYLRYFLECTETEMAEALGISHGTVKSRLHRAMARLRDILRKEYPQVEQERLDVS